jgi:hypothetical protein
MRPVIFDTDIGTDVDDILALAVLAKSPELKLIGVTTVYGNTPLRARITKVTCDLLGCAGTDVLIGEKETLTGRQITWAGHEGYGVPNLDKAEVSTTPGAVDYLLEKANRFAGELEVLATGPLTNIASAIKKDAAAFSKIKHLYLMGGAFGSIGPSTTSSLIPRLPRLCSIQEFLSPHLDWTQRSGFYWRQMIFAKLQKLAGGLAHYLKTKFCDGGSCEISPPIICMIPSPLWR